MKIAPLVFASTTAHMNPKLKKGKEEEICGNKDLIPIVADFCSYSSQDMLLLEFYVLPDYTKVFQPGREKAVKWFHTLVCLQSYGQQSSLKITTSL